MSKLKDIEFCKDCGEYITSDGDCSNPFCPEEMDDCQCDECIERRDVEEESDVN